MFGKCNKINEKTFHKSRTDFRINQLGGEKGTEEKETQNTPTNKRLKVDGHKNLLSTKKKKSYKLISFN